MFWSIFLCTYKHHRVNTIHGLAISSSGQILAEAGSVVRAECHVFTGELTGKHSIVYTGISEKSERCGETGIFMYRNRILPLELCNTRRRKCGRDGWSTMLTAKTPGIHSTQWLILMVSCPRISVIFKPHKSWWDTEQLGQSLTATSVSLPQAKHHGLVTHHWPQFFKSQLI